MTLPTPVPVVSPEAAPFWEATARHQLVLQHCDACDRTIFYPRVLCPLCHSQELAWREASGRGTIYSFTVTSRGTGDYAGAGAYVLALVELAEGPKMLTNIVECDPATLTIGAEVEVVFHDTGSGQALPRFRPVP